MMTGKELARIEKPAEMVTYSEYRTQYMTETFAWDYNKYGNPIKWLREGNPETGRFFKFCDRYKMSAQFDLVLLDSGDRLKDLTTADVQKKLCGALNAKRTFIWIFGVNSEVIVEGCVLDRDTRDTIRQSFSFALESEFVPPLECHNMANITFIPVHGNESNCFVIEITLNCTSDRMYQLSSGRVFFMKDDGKIDEIANMTEARRIVLYKEIEHLKEQCSADEEERKRNLGTPV
ncbi:hypothetical protein WR25_13831 isoform C [Diploscapter pachys]|nr:hypothetical protein WR25_13831 isoform B [Diploscapter pachys]PAV74324.1 hypothetical protein WR25_13831 isoform C [Diploscapter pachys]